MGTRAPLGPNATAGPSLLKPVVSLAVPSDPAQDEVAAIEEAIKIRDAAIRLQGQQGHSAPIGVNYPNPAFDYADEQPNWQLRSLSASMSLLPPFSLFLLSTPN